MTELPLSQQAAPKAPDTVFERIWSIYPKQGKARTVGLKPNSKRKHGLTPMERCREATKAALYKVSENVLIGALEAYVERHLANENGKYIKGLEWWLEQGQWEVEDIKPREGAGIEARPVTGKSWQNSKGQVHEMLSAMSEQGCPDDILDALFADGIGVTHVNASKGVPPTAVLRTTHGDLVWWRAANGYAERAGYNRIAYSKAYLELAQKKRAFEQEAENA
jgi:hypothetical protein